MPPPPPSQLASKVRYAGSLRKLARHGVNALLPYRLDTVHTYDTATTRGVRWRKPGVSKRVARVLRKQAVRSGTYGQFDATTWTGWDPVWDTALRPKPQQPSFVRPPKLPRHQRNREERARKLEARITSLDDEIAAYYQEKHDKKPEMGVEELYKRMIQKAKK